MNLSPDTYQLNQTELANAARLNPSHDVNTGCIFHDKLRAFWGKAHGVFTSKATLTNSHNIQVLLYELGDLPQAKHLNVPDFKRVIDVIKENGFASKEIIRILDLPEMYVAFAKHIQYPRALSLERLYKAFRNQQIQSRAL